MNESFNSFEVLETDIKKCFAGLNLHHCSCPDNLHPLIMITCKDSIKAWLKAVLNVISQLGFCSFIDKNVPSSWKMSNISPLHESGDVADINNYGPLTRNNIFRIMLDFLDYQQIQPYLSKFINPQQHGFIECKSTVTNLVTEL